MVALPAHRGCVSKSGAEQVVHAVQEALVGFENSLRCPTIAAEVAVIATISASSNSYTTIACASAARCTPACAVTNAPTGISTCVYARRLGPCRAPRLCDPAPLARGSLPLRRLLPQRVERRRLPLVLRL
jgi:hypothetical protein